MKLKWINKIQSGEAAQKKILNITRKPVKRKKITLIKGNKVVIGVKKQVNTVITDKTIFGFDNRHTATSPSDLYSKKMDKERSRVNMQREMCRDKPEKKSGNTSFI